MTREEIESLLRFVQEGGVSLNSISPEAIFLKDIKK
jgi:hypothetical protein